MKIRYNERGAIIFKKKRVFMTNKDCNFCNQILQVVAILDKKLKVFIFFSKIIFPLGCGYPKILNLLNSFKY